jgi:hypothetical protein
VPIVSVFVEGLYLKLLSYTGLPISNVLLSIAAPNQIGRAIAALPVVIPV